MKEGEEEKKEEEEEYEPTVVAEEEEAFEMFDSDQQISKQNACNL